jgi:hypothetical protein
VAAQYPNRRCTCGFTRFREIIRKTEETVERWMFFEDPGGGFGATPFGTYFGAGSGTGWGLFSNPLRTTRRDTVCESCSRVRISKLLGSIAVFGAFIDNGYFYVVASDLSLPATCYSVRFDGPESFEVPLSFFAGVPPAVLAPTPPTTAPSPPIGAATVDSMLRALVPEVVITGTYTVVLVDRCCGCEYPIAEVTLEAPPMIFTPLDADLGGAPQQWLYGGSVHYDLVQPASGIRLSIPFDYVDAVAEYDSRLNSLPSAQGWTHQGAGVPGNYQLIDGKGLQMLIVAGQSSYWSKTISLSASPGRIYGYSYFAPNTITFTNPGDGYYFQGRYALSVGGTYAGARLNFAGGLPRTTALDGLSGSTLRSTQSPPGWLRLSGGDDNFDGIEAAWFEAEGSRGAYFGTDGLPAAFEMIAEFGDRGAAGNDLAYIRNTVISAGGRFIRPQFTAFAQVANPRLRLYLIADSNSSPDKSARFLVRYGVGTGDPYVTPPSTTSQTVNFTTANVMFEVPLTLTGLTAQQPFWFTIERDWAHVDDKLVATVHMTQCTVRSQ